MRSNTYSVRTKFTDFEFPTEKDVIVRRFCALYILSITYRKIEILISRDTCRTTYVLMGFELLNFAEKAHRLLLHKASDQAANGQSLFKRSPLPGTPTMTFTLLSVHQTQSHDRTYFLCTLLSRGKHLPGHRIDFGHLFNPRARK